MEYQYLERLLLQAAQTDDSNIWVSANDLTNEIILETLSEIRRSKGNFVVVDFPCDNLKIIDQLWIEYSQGHFGFSVQQSIYENCADLEKFYDCVSWKYSKKSHPFYDMLRFGYPLTIIAPDYGIFPTRIQQWIVWSRKASIKAAKGNLPYCINLVPAILLRLKACE